MGGKSGQTIGFHYIMTVLAGFGRGPENGVLAVGVDDKLAWYGDVTDDTPTPINQPDLFGGEKKEGGIQGAFRLLLGGPSQVLPGAVSVNVGSAGPCAKVTIPDIKAAIGGRVSEMRGFTSFLYRGLVSSMNPYPKEWKFLRWRTTAGWAEGECWYAAKATIMMAGDGHPLEGGQSGSPVKTIGSVLFSVVRAMVGRSAPYMSNAIRAMNPAHIVRQALTDPDWGAARKAEELDENSFILAANTLCAEGFGLCINWARQEDIDTFIQSVIDHAVGALYTDRATGKLVLKLLRFDYDPATVPHYDAYSGLLEIEEDDSAAGDEAINEIILKGKDQSIVGRGKQFEVRAQSNAARQAEGAISYTLDLPGIPTRALGLRRAEMELRTNAPGLKRFKLKLDRRAWKLTPASVIRISAPNNDITNVILRIGEIDHGSSTDKTIMVRAVEDVFSLDASSFREAPSPSTWEPPSQAAQPAAAHRLVEAGYRDTILRVGEANIADVQPTDALIGQLAMSPGFAYEYDLATKAEGESDFVVRATGYFTERLLLTAPLAALDTTLTVADEASELAVGQALMIDDEVVRVDGIAGLTLTIARGCADTIPAAHAAGAAAWTIDDDLIWDQREYVAGETVHAKVLTRTSNSVLELDDAETDTIDLVARQDKPLPPGDVTVDGDSIFTLSGAYPEPLIEWAHRDRLTQAEQLVEHGAPSIGPEAGTTYTLVILSSDGATTLRTEAAIAGTSFTYDSAMQLADGAPPSVQVRLKAVRDGVDSWQAYQFKVALTEGYGIGYGLNYGGA